MYYYTFVFQVIVTSACKIQLKCQKILFITIDTQAPTF